MQFNNLIFNHPVPPTFSVTLLKKLFGEDDPLERSSHVEFHVEGLSVAGSFDRDAFYGRLRGSRRPYAPKEEHNQVYACRLHFL